eukprot:289421_1
MDVSFAFGQEFCYYDCNHMYDNYIECKYAWLKHELMCNPYCTLNENQYYILVEKAINYKQSKKFEKITAGGTNDEATIEINDAITINHIICLLIYCNNTEMQRIFKNHTRKLRIDEQRQSLYKRHSFIAHWTRYLSESCWYYGTDVKTDEYFYCGMDTKLIFNSFNFSNNSPLSTTTDIVVAQNFATHKGIILKLTHHNSWSTVANIAKYFDMMLLSDYTYEKEKLFCKGNLTTVDIIIDGNTNQDTVSALRLLQLILHGSLFCTTTNKDLYSKTVQNRLIQLLKTFMKNNLKVDYFDKLTVSLIESYIYRTDQNDSIFEKTLALNIPELNKLNGKLSNYFLCEKQSIFSKYCKNDFTLNIIKNIFEIKLDKSQLQTLIFTDKMGYMSVPIGHCVVENIPFEFIIWKHKQNEKEMFLFCTTLNMNTKDYMRIHVTMDVVFEEINVEYIGKHLLLSKENSFKDVFEAISVESAQKLTYSKNGCLTVRINLRVD